MSLRSSPIIGAADEFAAAANIANSVDLGPVVALVIAGTTLLTGKASGEAVNQCVLVDVELDHVVEPTPVIAGFKSQGRSELVVDTHGELVLFVGLQTRGDAFFRVSASRAGRREGAEVLRFP